MYTSHYLFLGLYDLMQQIVDRRGNVKNERYLVMQMILACIWSKNSFKGAVVPDIQKFIVLKQFEK